MDAVDSFEMFYGYPLSGSFSRKRLCKGLKGHKISKWYHFVMWSKQKLQIRGCLLEELQTSSGLMGDSITLWMWQMSLFTNIYSSHHFFWKLSADYYVRLHTAMFRKITRKTKVSVMAFFRFFFRWAVIEKHSTWKGKPWRECSSHWFQIEVLISTQTITVP